MTIISLIAAMGEGRVIGIDNRLPWRLPADLKRFREVTMGKPILMGRKTFVSIGKPLAGRRNIVVTQDRAFHAEGVTVAHTIDEAIAAAGDAAELMVIGGAVIYSQLLPRADRLYFTEIHQRFEGDAFFPAYVSDQWREVERTDHAADEGHAHAYSFVLLDRRR